MICQAKSLSALVLALSPFLFCSCAGPATPLGAVWGVRVAEVKRSIAQISPFPEKPTEVRVRFDPPRQVLHTTRPMTVVIQDPEGVQKDFRLMVLYNDLDVTESFLHQAHMQYLERGREVKIRIPTVRLSDNGDNRIEVLYQTATGELVSANYQPPVCSALEHKTVLRTDEFDPGEWLLSMIDRVSSENEINPALTAGLVAQESGFDTRRVSWARALGLTQVTPAADEELLKLKPRWPRYPGVSTLPPGLLKLMVMSGNVNERNDYRLNAELSVRGGLAFARMLLDHWSTPENEARIAKIYSNTELGKTQLFLASYNSGYARVSAAFARYGSDWLSAPDLHEARRYVNRIFSYCDDFSQSSEVDL